MLSDNSTSRHPKKCNFEHFLNDCHNFSATADCDKLVSSIWSCGYEMTTGGEGAGVGVEDGARVGVEVEDSS